MNSSGRRRIRGRKVRVALSLVIVHAESCGFRHETNVYSVVRCYIFHVWKFPFFFLSFEKRSYWALCINMWVASGTSWVPWMSGFDTADPPSPPESADIKWPYKIHSIWKKKKRIFDNELSSRTRGNQLKSCSKLVDSSKTYLALLH